MNYDFSTFDTQTQDIVTWLAHEYKSISTGRATPTVLDSITIDAYGSRTHIAHVASINIEDARTLRVSPWDKTQVKAIEKAIQDADLGLSVAADDAGLRVIFPYLTEETRTKLVKILKEKLEDARVRVRQAREEANKAIDAAEKEGGMSEDEKFKLKETLQKKVEHTNSELETTFSKKEKDTLTV
jgi:ribosome recycling factor